MWYVYAVYVLVQEWIHLFYVHNVTAHCIITYLLFLAIAVVAYD